MNERKEATSRHAVLDLAPLELDCMNMLWPMGEGTVREIRDALATRRPRAYTTIMTIMDRLARKGIVERRKIGRAYTYRANLSAESARTQALAQVIESFFGGSKESLIAHLDQPEQKPRALAAAISGGAVTSAVPVTSPSTSGGTISAAASPTSGDSIT
ncbi:MAG TPA: BlaI/MecI/CopY family transcriptional regulator [Candidatus Acidoferrales bacterium]|nr:BlaI/MecI/CopY family transcriptional regulator [Candidatus Acidoferrales bacterium]